MNDIKRGIRYAFQTENNMTISMSGSGHAAMECAVFNTVEPGESVLVAINGIWGERVAEIAERMGTSLRTVLRTHPVDLQRIKGPYLYNIYISVHLLIHPLMYSFTSLILNHDFFSLGANVHKMVKTPGGYFSNKEIEQVGTVSLYHPINY